MVDEASAAVHPHPRILQRRLVVALQAARATCLHQLEELHASLGVLQRSGFVEAPAFQAALQGHRAALLALDPAQPSAATEIMGHVGDLCQTMNDALVRLRLFLEGRPDLAHTTLVSPPST